MCLNGRSCVYKSVRYLFKSFDRVLYCFIENGLDDAQGFLNFFVS
jgi:hypothetical protein